MIKLVVFDWAGTTIDYGCMAPVKAFEKAFKDYKIDLTLEEIREPMGILKVEHIKVLLKMPRVSQLFNEIYQRDFTQEDVQGLNELFEKYLFEVLKDYTTPIPGVIETIAKLREKGIYIGSTTGYSQDMMKVVSKEARDQGYFPDFLSTAQSAKAGRPDSKMIEENMKYFNITSIDEVIKVGDTLVDIEEGRNALVKTVGIIKGSSLLSKTIDESVSESDIENAKAKYLNHKADFVVEEFSEIYDLIMSL